MPRSIGRDLLDIPFAEMVRNLALAIAEGQTALDANSLNTLEALASTQIDVVTDLTEIIEPDERVVEVEGRPIRVTGARIRPSGVHSMPMTMVQAGLLPTFYQFSQASIEVKLTITLREVGESEEEIQTVGPGFLGLGRSKAFASSVDYRHQNKYSYSATGASVLRATMVPVPPPSRVTPRITSINTFTSPPTVTRESG
jgi:hypothetical protein